MKSNLEYIGLGILGTSSILLIILLALTLGGK